MLNIAVKTGWTQALRSGEYKQGQERLVNPATNGYCCLGVLAAVSGIPVYDGAFVFPFSLTYCYTSLPDSFMADAGLDIDSMCELVDMNDVQLKSFDEIADYIEANL